MSYKLFVNIYYGDEQAFCHDKPLVENHLAAECDTKEERDATLTELISKFFDSDIKYRKGKNDNEESRALDILVSEENLPVLAEITGNTDEYNKAINGDREIWLDEDQLEEPLSEWLVSVMDAFDKLYAYVLTDISGVRTTNKTVVRLTNHQLRLPGVLFEDCDEVSIEHIHEIGTVHYLSFSSFSYLLDMLQAIKDHIKEIDDIYNRDLKEAIQDTETKEAENTHLYMDLDRLYTFTGKYTDHEKVSDDPKLIHSLRFFETSILHYNKPYFVYKDVETGKDKLNYYCIISDKIPELITEGIFFNGKRLTINKMRQYNTKGEDILGYAIYTKDAGDNLKMAILTQLVEKVDGK